MRFLSLMRWQRSFGVMAAVVGLLAAWPAQAEFDRAAAIRLAASVLKVEVLRGQGGYSIGSGVAVATDRVVTNCHVTRDAASIFIVRGGQRWRATAQAVDSRHDLCVLRAPGLLASIVSLADSAALQLGQNTLALGYTGGVDMQHSIGDIVGLFPLDGAPVIQLRNGFNSGASGGGLFDTEQRLIGILTFRLRGGASHYFAAPIDWLRPLLAETTDFRPIGPQDSQALPYWQQPTALLPPFLQRLSTEMAQERERERANP